MIVENNIVVIAFAVVYICMYERPRAQAKLENKLCIKNQVAHNNPNELLNLQWPWLTN